MQATPTQSPHLFNYTSLSPKDQTILSTFLEEKNGERPTQGPDSSPWCVGMCWGAKALWLSLEFIEKEFPYVCLGYRLNLKPSPFQDLEESTKGGNKCVLSRLLLTRELISEEQTNHSNSARMGLILFVVSFI